MSAILLLVYLILFVAYVAAASVAIARARRRAKAEPEFKRSAWVSIVLWLLPAAFLAYTLLEVLFLDIYMKRLCAKDGGVRIYEVVRLPKEDFGPDGDVFSQHRGKDWSDGRFGPDFAYIRSHTEIFAGITSLVRLHSAFVRKTDGKLVGESVRYARGGWSIPGPWHTSGESCPQARDINLTGQLFRPQER